MNRKSTFVAAFLAASAVFFGTAYAGGPACDHDGRHGMKHGEMQGQMHSGMMEPGTRAEQRLTRFKSVLKVTPQQEPLWQAFAEKSKAAADKVAQTMREHHKNDKPVSAPERMARMQGVMKDRIAGMESIGESFNRLYAALTPEQQAAVDQQFSGAGRHPHDAEHGHHGKPRGEGKGSPKAAEPKKG